MPKQRIKIKITKEGNGGSFDISLYDLSDADKIIDFLMVDPLIHSDKLIDYSKQNKRHYMKIHFLNRRGEYFFQAKTSKKIFDLFVPLGKSKGVKNTIDYLFKIMTPTQKVKFALWLEGVE